MQHTDNYENDYQSRDDWSAIKWNILNSGLKLVLRMVSSILFMCWIEPSVYGQYAIAIVAIEGLRYIIEKGYVGAIVQSPTVSLKHVSFLIKKNIKTSIWIIFVTLPIPLLFFQSIRFELISLIISLLFFAGTIVPLSFLRKKMAFKKLVTFDLTALTISILLALPLAYHGFGLWSLVIFYLTNVVLVWAFYSTNLFLIKKGVEQEDSIDFLGFNTSIMVNNVFLYFSSNLDQILITSFFGASFQGWYNRALTIISTPVSSITGAIAEVLTSSFSIESIENRRKRYFKNLRIVLMLLVPFLTMVFLLIQKKLTRIVGENWGFIIELSPYILVATFPLAMNYLFTAILISSGQKKLIYQGMIMKRTIEIVFLLGGVCFGIIGLLIGKIIVEFGKMGVNFYQTKLILNAGIVLQLRNYLESVIVIIITLLILLFPINLFLLLGFILLLNLMVYLIFDRALIIEIIKSIKSFLEVN